MMMKMKMGAASTIETTTTTEQLSSLESGGGGVDGEKQLQAADAASSTDEAAPSDNLTPIEKDVVIRNYKAMLAITKWYVRVVGFLYAASRFVGYCNLTWATVVLLGGFCPLLHPSDLWSVSTLLVAEAARLATATFISTLRNQSHFRFLEMIFIFSILRNHCQFRFGFGFGGLSLHFAHFFSFSAQYGINMAVLSVATKRISHLHSYSHVDNAHNLRPALHLFYSLLEANSYLNLGTICVDNASYIALHLRGRRILGGIDGSFICYYEHVLEKLLRGSLGLADPIDFFHFAYVQLLGWEFQRNANTDDVVKRYGKMLEYLNAHPQGFDHLYVYLEHDNASVQLAAANVPGLWMLHPTTRARVEWLPDGLVTRLIRRLPDNREVGWAAANSLGTIAVYGKGDLLLSFGTKVGDALAAAVDPRTSCSLVLVRAMVFLVYGQVKELSSRPMPTSRLLSMIFSADTRNQLEKDLETLMKDASVHRLRALSAFLLFLLGWNTTLILPDTDPFLGITSTSESYLLLSEKEMQLYDQFRKRSGKRSEMPAFAAIDKDLKLTLPEWARGVL